MKSRMNKRRREERDTYPLLPRTKEILKYYVIERGGGGGSGSHYYFFRTNLFYVHNNINFISYLITIFKNSFQNKTKKTIFRTIFQTASRFSTPKKKILYFPPKSLQFLLIKLLKNKIKSRADNDKYIMLADKIVKVVS